MPVKAKAKKAAPKGKKRAALGARPASKKSAKAAPAKAVAAASGNVKPLKALNTNEFFKLETDMTKNAKQFDKITQDAAALGQDQFDALLKSTTIFSKGVEEIVKLTTQIAQEAGEQGASATKTLFSCKTLNEFAEAQSKLAQSSFDQFLSNATKLSELSAKIYTDSLAPINDQVGKTMKKASDAVAA